MHLRNRLALTNSAHLRLDIEVAIVAIARAVAAVTDASVFTRTAYDTAERRGFERIAREIDDTVKCIAGVESDLKDCRAALTTVRGKASVVRLASMLRDVDLPDND